MTGNQIAYKKAKEEERANRAKEGIEKKRMRRDTIQTAASEASKLFGKAIQDASWYNEDKELVKDVASVSFNNPLGTPFKNDVGETVAPGICAITFMPGIGMTDGKLASSPVNIAAKNIYGYVRHANSGSRNYDPDDLMKYLISAGEGYSLWSSLRRAYSLALTVKGHNRYYYKRMLYALGYDADDFQKHLAQYRTLINSFAVRMNSLYVPNNMSIYKRRGWLNSVILKDQPIKKSQVYMYVQEFFLQYNEITGELNTIAPDNDSKHSLGFYPGANHTFDEVYEFVNYFITNLISSEDIGIMSGDILKAYGEGNLYFLESTPEDYHIEAEYSAEALSQIQNTTLTGCNAGADFVIKSTEDGELYQGSAYYAPNGTEIKGYGIPTRLGQKASESFIVDGEHHLLNLYKDEATPDDVMVATRNIVGVVPEVAFAASSSNVQYAVNTFGTEIMLFAYAISLRNDGSDTFYRKLCMLMDENVSPFASYVVGVYNKFDWAPNVYFYSTNSFGDTAGKCTQDYANYTTLSTIVLSNLHYVAVMSLFGVPKLGMKVRTR